MHTSALSLPWLISISVLLIITISTANAAPNQAIKKYPSLATQFLVPHNAARYRLRLDPLTWDPKLAKYAQWYANKRRRDCALRHSDGPYGENIFWGSGRGWTAAQAVAAWAEEKKWYVYWSNSCVEGQECGHYTQVVWKTTNRIGCARVTCYNGRGVFITCNYDPPGNYIGEKPY